MAITILAAPIVEAAFVEQDYDDEEYYRRFHDGKPYTLDDDLGNKNMHLGQDMQRNGRPDTLYAVCDGLVQWVDLGIAFGRQIALRTKASGFVECAFYAHCESRVRDRTLVKAKANIGRMGTSGGVPEHLHFSWLANWKQHDTWRNPSPALRLLKESLLHPTPPAGEEDELLYQKEGSKSVYLYHEDHLHKVRDKQWYDSARLYKVKLEVLPATNMLWTLPVLDKTHKEA